MTIDVTKETDVAKIRKRTWHYLSPEVASCADLSLAELQQFVAHAYRPDETQLQPPGAKDAYDMTDQAPKRDTRFKPGYTPATRRRKGVQNRITRDLKHGIMTAAVNLGSDGRGKGGLAGYLTYLARKKPAAFAQLLGHLGLPDQRLRRRGVTAGVTGQHHLGAERPLHQGGDRGKPLPEGMPSAHRQSHSPSQSLKRPLTRPRRS